MAVWEREAGKGLRGGNAPPPRRRRHWGQAIRESAPLAPGRHRLGPASDITAASAQPAPAPTSFPPSACLPHHNPASLSSPEQQGMSKRLSWEGGGRQGEKMIDYFAYRRYLTKHSCDGFAPSQNPMSYTGTVGSYHTHCRKEEMEGLRREETCPRSHSCTVIIT